MLSQIWGWGAWPQVERKECSRERGQSRVGSDLPEAHAVGLLPDLSQPQPLLHLAVPGDRAGGQLGGCKPLPFPFRPGPTGPRAPPAAASLLTLPVEGCRQRLHLLHGRRLLPLVELALDLILQLVAHLGRTGWGSCSCSLGPVLSARPPRSHAALEDLDPLGSAGLSRTYHAMLPHCIAGSALSSQCCAPRRWSRQSSRARSPPPPPRPSSPQVSKWRCPGVGHTPRVPPGSPFRKDPKSAPFQHPH